MISVDSLPVGFLNYLETPLVRRNIVIPTVLNVDTPVEHTSHSLLLPQTQTSSLLPTSLLMRSESHHGRPAIHEGMGGVYSGFRVETVFLVQTFSLTSFNLPSRSCPPLTKFSTCSPFNTRSFWSSTSSPVGISLHSLPFFLKVRLRTLVPSRIF